MGYSLEGLEVSRHYDTACKFLLQAREMVQYADDELVEFIGEKPSLLEVRKLRLALGEALVKIRNEQIDQLKRE